MRGLLRTLSISYLRVHVGKTLLAVLGIAMGVATFVSVKAAQRTLESSFHVTVEQLAGRADLQVTGVGGVPEGVQEALRDLDVVRAYQPVIEQVVRPEKAGLGTLLILGVDLVGDTEMRDYGFGDEDADVDDPLVFLAQPDSIALNRDFAARAGVNKGDSLGIRVGDVVKQLSVRALLEPKGFARAYGGNIGVVDVYSAEDLFGRGRRFDRIDVRLEADASRNQALAEIGSALGPGYRIRTPEERGAALQGLASSFLRRFDATSVLALGIGLFLIFNVFAIGVQRRRRDIGILRALGAKAWQIGALFLIEAAGLGAIGGAIGVVAGTMLADGPYEQLGAALEAMHGLAHAGLAAVTTQLMVQGIAIGTMASVVGAGVPAFHAARVPPIDAMATGVFLKQRPRTSPRLAVGGLLLFVAAFLIARFGLVPPSVRVPIVIIPAAAGAIVLTGRLALILIGPLTPVLSRLAPAAGRLATDALRGQPRRTAATGAVLTLSTTFVLGTAGFLQAMHGSVDRWISNAITADLIVRASPGLGPSSIRLPYGLRQELLDIPGVTAVDGFRQERVDFGMNSVALVSIDSAGFASRTRHEFIAGDETAFTRHLPFNHQCVVSDNFARRSSLSVGDIVTLDSPAGEVRLPIAAIVVDFISDRGSVMIDRSTFLANWGDDRVDSFHVSVRPGIDPVAIRGAVHTRIGAGTPLLVSTRQEFVEEVENTLRSLFAVIRATAIVVLVVSFMGIASSLLVSVAERSRGIGIVRALGAARRQVGAAVMLEAITLALVSLAMAVPLGELLSWFLRATRWDSGFRFPHVYPLWTACSLLVGLPVVSVVATWLPARWAARLNVAAAIAYE